MTVPCESTDGPQFACWLAAQQPATPDHSVWHSVSNWSAADILIIAISIVLMWWVCVMARYLWITRRQPVRNDAPTGGSWTDPRPWR